MTALVEGAPETAMELTCELYVVKAAAVLGWFFGGVHLVDDSWILTTHRWVGTTTAASSVLLLVVGERTFRRADASRTGYRAMLFIGAGLVGVTGFFGGSLIYGIAHYSWP